MPYIKTDEILEVRKGGAINAGELNYEFTRVITQYLYKKRESYQTYNDIMGALEGAKLELYRRMIAPYEDNKMEENGDVYG